MFSFKRFINVARWDLSVNSKFYSRSALLMATAICMPVLLPYLYSILMGKYHMFWDAADNVEIICYSIGLIGLVLSVISSGYMFHNLLTRQGRINELTLPATNLERFLWHAVVIVIGVQLVCFVGVVCADVLHALFRLAIPEADIRSITYYFYVESFRHLNELGMFDDHGLGFVLLIFILECCYCRSFCLVNAWKYRYNIPWTLLIYFVLMNVFSLLLITIFTHIAYDKWERIGEWLIEANPTSVLVCLNILALLLYVGIWLLTYHLYTRAQLTTKRNP